MPSAVSSARRRSSLPFSRMRSLRCSSWPVASGPPWLPVVPVRGSEELLPIVAIAPSDCLLGFMSDGARSGEAEQGQDGQNHDDHADDVENAIHGRRPPPPFVSVSRRV